MLVSPTQAAGALDVPNNEGRTVLMYAATHGLDSVVEQLLAAGARCELTDKDGLTALLHACGEGQRTAVDLLITPTAIASALDVQNAKGHSALMCAAEMGLCPTVERLVAAGAKPETTDKGGMTALALACVKLRDVCVLPGAKATAAETAAKITVGCWVRVTETFASNNKKSKTVPKDLFGRVEEIDDDGDANIYLKGIGGQWVGSSDFDKIIVLMPDLLVQSESGKLSLLPVEELLVKRAQRQEVVKMLVFPTQAAGALDVPNNEGRTVLMYAATHGLYSVVEQLLAAGVVNEFGAKPEPTDKIGVLVEDVLPHWSNLTTACKVTDGSFATNVHDAKLGLIHQVREDTHCSLCYGRVVFLLSGYSLSARILHR